MQVGIAMPRYCLFGETVTIAEQLEERSQAGKILVSQAVYDSLQAGPRTPICDELGYEKTTEPFQLPGAAVPTAAYFVLLNAPRRRHSIAMLEEMAAAQLQYFAGRTVTPTTSRTPSKLVADDGAPSNGSSIANSRNRSRDRSRRASAPDAMSLPHGSSQGAATGAYGMLIPAPTARRNSRFRARHASADTIDTVGMEQFASAGGAGAATACSAPLSKRKVRRFSSPPEQLANVHEPHTEPSSFTTAHGDGRHAQEWVPYGNGNGDVKRAPGGDDVGDGGGDGGGDGSAAAAHAPAADGRAGVAATVGEAQRRSDDDENGATPSAPLPAS